MGDSWWVQREHAREQLRQVRDVLTLGTVLEGLVLYEADVAGLHERYELDSVATRESQDWHARHHRRNEQRLRDLQVVVERDR